jgi:hypothetical protein
LLSLTTARRALRIAFPDTLGLDQVCGFVDEEVGCAQRILLGARGA